MEYDGEDAAAGIDGDDTGSYEEAPVDTATTQEDGGEDDTASPTDDGNGDGATLSGAEETDVVTSSEVDEDSLAAAAAAEAPLNGEGVADDPLSPPEERDGTGDGFIDGWGKHGIEGQRHPFRHALASYDALLKEHYLKMSFAQVSKVVLLLTLSCSGTREAVHIS